MPWTLIDNGSFNWIYCNGAKEDGDLILKITRENKSPLDTKAVDTMDNYARSVRIWNEINPDLDPPARIEEATFDTRKQIGWVCPFVTGTQPSDKEVSQALIDIFNRTGRIILDATAKNNFKKTPSGKVVCIDVGMAVQLEARDETCLVGTRRRSSFSSLDTYHEMSHTYTNWFADQPYHANVPETIQTVKALLFIKDHRYDIDNVNFLTNNPQALAILANAYDMEHVPDSHPGPTPTELEKIKAVHAAEHLLAEECDLSLESIKQYCRDKLSQALTPASSPTVSNHATNFNTQYALELLRQVNQCQNIDDMEHVYAAVNDMEALLDTKTSPSLPLPMEQVAIRQVNRTLLTELKDRDNVSVSKHNCLQILTQFLEKNSTMQASELTSLHSQFSSSPKEKVSYYKSQIGNQILSNREKEVLQLIKWIDNATTFEEIDEFILKFEASLPPPRDREAMGYIERIYAIFSKPPLEERLRQSLAQCKLAVATAKAELDKKPEEQNSLHGSDMV